MTTHSAQAEATATSQAQRYSLTDLGDLGGGDSDGWGINNSGEVVGSSTMSDHYRYASLYNPQNSTSMRALTRVYVGAQRNGVARAYDINDSEQIVGQDGFSRGFSLVNATNALTPLDAYTKIAQSIGYAINSSGVVVGLAGNGSGQVATLWHGHTPMSLNDAWKGSDPIANNSIAWDINDSGQVVGHAIFKDKNLLGYTRAFLYSDANMDQLPVLGTGHDSRAFGINNSGQVVGESNFARGNVAVHAFLYTNGGMKDLNSTMEILSGPNGTPITSITNSSAKGINKFGHVVGWFNVAGYQRRAFFYKDGIMHDLNTMLGSGGTGWTLVEARAINDRCQIVVNALNKVGARHALLLTPISCP